MTEWIAACAAAAAIAQSPASEKPFEKGAMEIQLGVSLSDSFNTRSRGSRPHIRDAAGHLRVGWMLTRPGGSGAFRGNWELLAEAVSSRILDGPGDALYGLTGLLRYNCLSLPGGRSFYLQLGFGGLNNDIHEDGKQDIIGQQFEFNILGSVGARFPLSSASSWYVEAGWRHISNADMAVRNFGLNSVYVQLGLGWWR